MTKRCSSPGNETNRAPRIWSAIHFVSSTRVVDVAVAGHHQGGHVDRGEGRPDVDAAVHRRQGADGARARGVPHVVGEPRQRRLVVGQRRARTTPPGTRWRAPSFPRAGLVARPALLRSPHCDPRWARCTGSPARCSSRRWCRTRSARSCAPGTSRRTASPSGRPPRRRAPPHARSRRRPSRRARRPSGPRATAADPRRPGRTARRLACRTPSRGANEARRVKNRANRGSVHIFSMCVTQPMTNRMSTGPSPNTW